MRDGMGGLRVLVAFFLLSSSASGLLVTEGQGGQGGQWGQGEARESDTFNKESDTFNKAILEMLHIDKVSASHHQVKPHPYMRHVYLLLDTPDAHGDLQGNSDATLVQSFRRIFGPQHAPPGWMWFNITQSNPSMMGAELVLFRKTLHPRPLSVTVTLHSLVTSEQEDRWAPREESGPLEERTLTLDQRPSSGYDVFDVSPVLDAAAAAEPSPPPPDHHHVVVGFQLRYTDETGSLELHEALTHSLYCLRRGSLREPLLVLYHSAGSQT